MVINRAQRHTTFAFHNSGGNAIMEQMNNWYTLEH